MPANDVSRFQFNYQAFFFAEIAFDKVVVVDFAEEADPLAIFSLGRGEIVLRCNLSDFRFQQIPDREHQFRNLYVTYLP